MRTTTPYAENESPSTTFLLSVEDRARAEHLLGTIGELELMRFRAERLALESVYDRAPSILLDHLVSWRDVLEGELAELLTGGRVRVLGMDAGRGDVA